jgi:hypothetical protein
LLVMMEMVLRVVPEVWVALVLLVELVVLEA